MRSFRLKQLINFLFLSLVLNISLIQKCLIEKTVGKRNKLRRYFVFVFIFSPIIVFVFYYGYCCSCKDTDVFVEGCIRNTLFLKIMLWHQKLRIENCLKCLCYNDVITNTVILNTKSWLTLKNLFLRPCYTLLVVKKFFSIIFEFFMEILYISNISWLYNQFYHVICRYY